MEFAKLFLEFFFFPFRDAFVYSPFFYPVNLIIVIFAVLLILIRIVRSTT